MYFSTYPPPTLIHLSYRFTSAPKPTVQKSLHCCLSHFRPSVSSSATFEGPSRPSCEPLYATNTSHRKQETFLYGYPLRWVPLCTKKKTPFWQLKPASEHARLLPKLSWSWTVLLPSDVYRKPITSITAVSLRFVIYLLTLLRMNVFRKTRSCWLCHVGPQ
jgi:hypothetical protein